MNKKVLLIIDNVRIKEYNEMNVVVERYEDVYVPTKKQHEKKWRFKGYASTIFKALLLIQRNELLIDKDSIHNLSSYLEQVKESNDKLLEAVIE